MNFTTRKVLFSAAVLFMSAALYGVDTTRIRVTPAGPAIQEALDRAVKVKDAPVVVELEEGIYSISKPLCLTSSPEGGLTVRGKGIGKTMISGGITLPAFKEGPDGLWTIDLEGMPLPGNDIQQLYINGERAVYARTPDTGWYFITGKVNETKLERVNDAGNTETYGVQTMQLAPEHEAVLRNLHDRNHSRLSISFLHAWDLTRRYVDSLSFDRHKLSVNGKLMHEWNTLDRENASQFYMEGDFSFLDQEGEWFYDSDASKIYYKPLPGQDMASSVAVTPSTCRFLTVEGKAGSPVKGVRIQDISFLYSRFTMQSKGIDQQQSAASSDASVMLSYARDIHFRDCEISHTGNNGIWFNAGCLDCSASHCYLHDIGIGGVKIGPLPRPSDASSPEIARGIVIDNNIITAGSRVQEVGCGVLLFHASDCSITHNEISDFYYTGISVGWVWGYSFSASKRNTVRFNHIHHIGWGVLSDMGGVYTLGLSEGTVVSDNVIHDIYSFEYGGWGLYTDEGSTGITMENNLVYNCKSSGFHQHYGQDNVIRNNIFASSLVYGLQASRVEDHNSFTFSNNIVYLESPLYGSKWDEVKAIVDYNWYWRVDKPMDFNGVSQEEWTRSTDGKDAHSIVADPGFRDPSRGDWTIRNHRALKKSGFKPFDYSHAGVYGSSSWKELAKMPQDRLDLFEKVVTSYKAKYRTDTK